MFDATNAPERVSSDAFRAPKRESTVESVIRRVKNLLVNKSLKPGDKLPNENDLSESLNVSRGSVREAMKILAAYGIVQIYQGDGTYISKEAGRTLFDPFLFNFLLTERDKTRLMELRELLEVGIERLIIKNASDNDLCGLENAHKRMIEEVEKGTRDPYVLSECDLEFHHALGAVTKNDYVSKVYDFVLEFLAPFIEETHVIELSGDNALRLHQDILDALKARDAEWATIAIRRSIQQWFERFTV